MGLRNTSRTAQAHKLIAKLEKRRRIDWEESPAAPHWFEILRHIRTTRAGGISGMSSHMGGT